MRLMTLVLALAALGQQVACPLDLHGGGVAKHQVTEAIRE